ncbi:ABC transporter permease subunit [Halovivax gelatinilyticus]|uniref:ABC transporter permease subunit n=1 Tax=Halovivax gelatinilyticus TaxID=2961597 RepID=UPI0020CA2A0E|nr:ABC transporter permease subunit [Halovivax gelatinilyticus]
MSVLIVAKKEFNDAIRSQTLLILIGLFVLLQPVVALYAVVTGSNAEDGVPTAFFFTTAFVTVFLAPISALTVSVKSIVRERTLGTGKLLLSLPHTRGEIFFGKVLGRLAVFLTAVFVGFVPSIAIMMVGIDSFEPLHVVGMMVATVFFGVIFLVIGICASTVMKSESMAAVVGIGIFVFVYWWDSIVFTINAEFGLVDGRPLEFLSRFQLIIIGEDVANTIMWLTGHSETIASEAVVNGGDVPFYLHHWVSILFLATWIVVPLAVGYWAFNRTEF